jgi:hypothetical protein
VTWGLSHQPLSLLCLSGCGGAPETRQCFHCGAQKCGVCDCRCGGEQWPRQRWGEGPLPLLLSPAAAPLAALRCGGCPRQPCLRSWGWSRRAVLGRLQIAPPPPLLHCLVNLSASFEREAPVSAGHVSGVEGEREREGDGLYDYRYAGGAGQDTGD